MHIMDMDTRMEEITTTTVRHTDTNKSIVTSTTTTTTPTIIRTSIPQTHIPLAPLKLIVNNIITIVMDMVTDMEMKTCEASFYTS